MKHQAAEIEVLSKVLKQFLTDRIPKFDSPVRLLVAVSGGVDSMALLSAALDLANTGFSQLYVAHLIHHPKSSEAQARAKLVEDFCRANHIPFFTEQLAEAEKTNWSPEERMRQQRYQFLEKVAKQYSCDYILTAHHADDQAETVLERIIVGTGLRGLAGIPAVRGNIFRPFISQTKAQLLSYCRQRQIPYADDPANLDLKSPRNRIRHHLLPEIEISLNPDVRGALCRLGSWAGEANELIENLVREAYEKAVVNFQKGKIVLDIQVILTYFTLIQKYLLHRALSQIADSEIKHNSSDYNRCLALAQTGHSGTYLEFPGGIRVARHRDTLIFTDSSTLDLSCTLTPGQEKVIPELSVRAVWEAGATRTKNSGCGNQANLWIGNPPSELLLRYAHAGDRFHPLGSPGEKRLFRFLNDRKVARFDKHTTLVLLKDAEIIWVLGHRISEKARVRPEAEGNWKLSLIPLE